MTALVTCIPCQHGNHDGHTPVVRQAPKDGYGGARCLCPGNCQPTAENLRLARLIAGVQA